MTTLTVPPTLQQSYDVDPTTIPHIVLDGVNPLGIRDPTTTTGAATIAQTLSRGDGGALGIGDGVAQRFSMDNDASVQTPAFQVAAEWSDASSESEDSEIVFSLSIAGIFAEGLRFRAVGIDTQIVSPFAFILSPNGDMDDGLRISTVANDVYVIPQQASNEFFLGNTVADPSVNLNRGSSRALSIIPLGTTITALGGGSGNWINFGSTIIMDYPDSTISGLVAASGTFEFNQNGNNVGAGNLFKNSAIFKNVPGSGTIRIGSQYTFVHIGNYQADTDAITNLFHRVSLLQTTWSTINGGTQAVTTINGGGFVNPFVNAGVTVTNMRDWEFLGSITGTVTNRAHIYFHPGNTPASTIHSGIQSLMSASANHRFIRHQGTAQSDFGGLIGLGTGPTVDWTIGRLAANIATLGAGDSLRIPATLFFGSAGSVNLSSTTSNRLDLASGDSFRIIDGALEHLAGTIGFNGATPVTQDTGWSTSNVIATRVLDANSTSLDELADIVGTVIDYLLTRGDFGA